MNFDYQLKVATEVLIFNNLKMN